MKRRTALDAGAEKVAGRSRSDKGPAKKGRLLSESAGPSLRPWWEYDSASPPAVDLGEIDLSVVPANDGEVR